MIILVIDADNLAEEVVQVLDDADVWNAPVEGIAHGTLVRICLAMNATVSVVAIIVIGVKVVMCCIIAASNVHIQPEFHTLLGTLGQQQIVGMATGSATIEYRHMPLLHSLISLPYEFLKGNAVWDGHTGVEATATNVVSSGLDFSPEAVDQDSMPAVLVNVHLDTIFVSNGGEVDTNADLLVVVCMVVDVVMERLVVKAGNVGMDRYITHVVCCVESVP